MDSLEKDLEKKIDAAESEAKGETINIVDEDTAQIQPEEQSEQDKDVKEASKEEVSPDKEASDDKSASDDSNEDAQDHEEKPMKEKKFFKKKKDKKDEKIEELTDRLQRHMAEFDNFRKRTEKEKSSMFDLGVKDVVEKILPIVDNFERGFDTTNDETTDSFADGMHKIHKQLVTVLTDLGVSPIEACGNEFDPNLHNAVMHVEDEEAGENIVVEEFQKGYTYKGSVVRHSMVKVAN